MEIDPMNWLDTRTQELLQGEPPLSLAPAKTAEFALVLLQKGSDDVRLVRAISRINQGSEHEARSLAAHPPPVAINTDLLYADALLGQFELISCDAAAAFLRTEVFEQSERGYLDSLFVRICQSPEFKPCTVSINYIPKSDAGRKFADQFLGIGETELRKIAFPLGTQVPLKKARIMTHWAKRIGAVLSTDPMP
jgi:hypothetical protein